jgi:hypothetical protein
MGDSVAGGGVVIALVCVAGFQPSGSAPLLVTLE